MRKLTHGEISRPDPQEARSLPKHPICVVVENVRSVHNVGSIFRTSDAGAVEHLYLTGITGTPENHALKKTALGAEESVAWSHHRETGDLLRDLAGRGYTIAVLEQTDSPTLPEALSPAHFPLCLVLGNEVSGVSEEAVVLADLAIELPQYGAKHSLNVSVAYGIALYGILGTYRRLRGQVG